MRPKDLVPNLCGAPFVWLLYEGAAISIALFLHRIGLILDNQESRFFVIRAMFEGEGKGEVAIFSAKRWDRRSS